MAETVVVENRRKRWWWRTGGCRVSCMMMAVHVEFASRPVLLVGSSDISSLLISNEINLRGHPRPPCNRHKKNRYHRSCT